MKTSWKVLSIITAVALVFSLGFLSGSQEKVMVTLDDIKKAVDNLEQVIQGAIASGKITPKQIITVQGLSDINNSLGTIRAGDFLAMSSGTEPTAADGTGTFMSALGRMFGSKTYHIGGVYNGDLKWGANALTGELEAGDGAVNLTADGISLYDGATEIGRFGNLAGFLSYPASPAVYGMAMGDSDQYMTYDQINGLQVSGALNDGWTKSFDTFTYVTANLVTVPGDQTDIYEVGCRWKFKQGAGWKYMYMISATYDAGDDETDIVVDAGNDFTVANAAITDPFYSYQSRPNGFPSPFNYTPTWRNYYAPDPSEAQPDIGASGELLGYYELNGNRVTGRIRMGVGGAGASEGGPDGGYFWTLPLDWDKATNGFGIGTQGAGYTMMFDKGDYSSMDNPPTVDVITLSTMAGATFSPAGGVWTSGFIRVLFDYWIAE